MSGRATTVEAATGLWTSNCRREAAGLHLIASAGSTTRCAVEGTLDPLPSVNRWSWQHVAAIYDGTRKACKRQCSIYIDGQERGPYGPCSTRRTATIGSFTVQSNHVQCIGAGGEWPAMKFDGLDRRACASTNRDAVAPSESSRCSPAADTPRRIAASRAPEQNAASAGSGKAARWYYLHDSRPAQVILKCAIKNADAARRRRAEPI